MQNIFVSSAGMRISILCFLAIFAMLAIQGCTSRPPNCTDAEIVLSAIENIADTDDKDTAGLRDYKNKVNLTNIEVVQNEFTKANGVCLSQITVNSPSGQKFVVRMGFRTVSLDGKTVRLTEVRQGFTDGVTGDMQQYVKNFDKNQPVSEVIKAPQPVSTLAGTQTVNAGGTNSVPLESTSTARADIQEKTPQAEASITKTSFDCAKATTSVEKSICSNTLLGKLDVALSENYKQMLMADLGKGGQANVKAEQRQWIQARNKCQDVKCLEQSYRKRVDETCEYGVVSGTHPICSMSDDIK
jgi:uncharacterized protein YecT (DUF1311 family)